MSYVSSLEAQKHFKVSDQTLRRWAKEKRIQFKITPGGHRRFLLPENEKNKIIYCRVSSSKQKEDLKKQIKYMQEKFPNHEVISDIGSGINFKRKGFLSLLRRVFEGNVSEVVVSSYDRISRFDRDFFTWLFKYFGCKFVCLNKKPERTYEQELSGDIISIVTVFAARYQGKRKYNVSKKD